MCNLDRFMGAYNFVGAYEHVSDHARALLAATARAAAPSTTLWEVHGARGWGRRPSPFERRAARLKGLNSSSVPSADSVSFFEKNVAHHKTSSSGKSDRCVRKRFARAAGKGKANASCRALSERTTKG